MMDQYLRKSEEGKKERRKEPKWARYFLSFLPSYLLTFLLLTLNCRRVEEPQGQDALATVQTPSGLEMVVIPGGWFEMGNADMPDEAPVHKVWVSSFWMDRCEVPQKQFRKYQISDPSHFKGENQPLERINWTDAAIYCNERSMAEGLQPCYDEQSWECNFDANGYRLPTEAEWEYTCRAGTSTRYSFGDDARQLTSYAWFAENSSGKTHPIGRKKPNPWGLYDMHGNVAEWCNDRYAKDYYDVSPDRDPRGPTTGDERVLRGGAWNSSADSCRSSYRDSDPSINDTCLAGDAIGFRCVRSAPSLHPQASLEGATHEGRRTALVYDDIYLEHQTSPGHPESPERLKAIIRRLEAGGLYPRLVHLAAKPASQEQLETVHSSLYIERVRLSCRDGESYLDSLDVPIGPRSYEAAVMAAGGVIVAADAVAKGQVTNAFCAVRPPGHHARRNEAMGFCIFNNVAIATRYVQREHRLSKVLIVDWDVHHGNGTQETFYDDPNVLYFSTHQWPFYPGTGSTSEKGSDKGLNHTINVPLRAGSGDDELIEAFEKRLRPAAMAFSPQFIFISAGFDAIDRDTLAQMKVTTEGFARLTRIVKDIADTCCQGRIVSVLEGGYALDGLAQAVATHIRVLME
jgi:acetoin utilization deacetylase AcuC-like enzyme/formylglycine-generating enzyme required for sulfatase activity